jgi:hypothetical protein
MKSKDTAKRRKLMKNWMFTVLALCLFAIPSWATMYQTSFPSTENPLLESGNWIDGGAVGLNWHDCRSTPGLAFGTQPGTAQYDDSTCVLSGTWGSTQTVEATVRVVRTDSAPIEEVEIRVRTTVTAHSITGYEVNCSVKPNEQYLQIVRWNGPLANFTYLGAASTYCRDGDVLKVVASGPTITAYKNGVQMVQVTDSTYSNGSPGMGFYIQSAPSTVQANFGFSNFSADDGTVIIDPNPSPSPNPDPNPTPDPNPSPGPGTGPGPRPRPGPKWIPTRHPNRYRCGWWNRYTCRWP